MALEIDDIDDSFNSRVRDVTNTTSSNNTANLAVDIDDVGNTDNSVNDSGNVGVDVADSFNEDSHDVDVETDVEIDDSFNDNSDNSTDDDTDNSVDDSYNDNSDNSVDDSYNDNSDHSVDDHSINAGARSYSTGFNDLTLGGAAGDGDVWVDNRATIVDQSVNANVAAHGPVGAGSGADAVVASGDDSIAAGDDIDIDQTLDESTTITGGGDVNVGNETEITTVIGSFNTWTDNSVETDGSIEVDIEDSWNDESESYTADNSFNEELVSVSENDWDIDANVIWGSDDSAIVQDVAVDLPPA
ncbi:MAG TPA: hypothetical protein VNT50_09300 [Microbacterium sp.]|uniref:hypothetical protein n=1 Tax=Microbacterium sp. TaxID=51671 RepID=UPI002CC33831|nr:hypothetical protein [Microbacterium sp.]HWI31679.1 hypothetical protein [Microbacterium sp.]